MTSSFLLLLLLSYIITHPPMYLSIHPWKLIVYLLTHPSIYVPMIISNDPSNYIFIYLSIKNNYFNSIILAEAIRIYKASKDLKKAVKYLVTQRFISDTPHEIANFLRVYKNKFDAG